MSIFKKIGGFVSKAVSTVTGVASKILPGPLGAVAGIASNVTGNIASSLSGSKAAPVMQAAQAQALQTGFSFPDPTKDNRKWYEKIPVWGWVVGVVGILAAIYFLFFGRKRRR